MAEERIRRALDQMLYLPHLQAQHVEPSLPAASPGRSPGEGGGSSSGGSGGQAAGKGRPWDRGDLFRRLATFKSSTWFCKPACIGPVECARRGWTNTGPDLLTCEFCKAKLSCPIGADLLPEQAASSGQRFSAGLGSAHDAACPWRAATSALSLLQFPPLTEEAVRRDFHARCAALQRLLCLPPIAEEAYDALESAASQDRLAQLLLQALPGRQAAQAAAAGAAAAEPADARGAVGEGVAVLDTPAFEARARLLALCGWDVKFLIATAGGDGAPAQQAQPAQRQGEADGLPPHVGPESAALQCSLCAAKAGLWAFFPQCKPLVLQAPRRKSSGGSSGGSASKSSSASLSKAAVSRNVAADMGMTIAGGAMLAGGSAGAAAQPFGTASQQAPAFGAGAGSDTPAAAAAAASGHPQQQQQAAPAGPFGAGSQGGGSVPAFGFAALRAVRPPVGGAADVCAARDAGVAGGASVKRKQPDFSWSAVMADIDAKAASEKRSKASTAGSAGGAAAAGAAGPANGAAPGSGGAGAQQAASSQQQRVAAAAAAAKYGGMQATPLNPLALHRPFCPWVNRTQAGEKEGRCGWRWVLQQLAAAPTAAESMAAASAAAAAEEGDRDGGGGSGSSRGREWDPAKYLRSMLQQVDVHK